MHVHSFSHSLFSFYLSLFQENLYYNITMTMTTHLSLDIKGNTEEKRAIEAHLQDVIPVLRLQHWLHTERDTERVRKRWTTCTVTWSCNEICPWRQNSPNPFHWKEETVDETTVHSKMSSPTQLSFSKASTGLWRSYENTPITVCLAEFHVMCLQWRVLLHSTAACKRDVYSLH